METATQRVMGVTSKEITLISAKLNRKLTVVMERDGIMRFFIATRIPNGFAFSASAHGHRDTVHVTDEVCSTAGMKRLWLRSKSVSVSASFDISDDEAETLIKEFSLCAD